MKEKEPTLKSIDRKIDDLASTMASYSISVEKRLDKIDQRFESIDQRFDKVDNEFKLVRAELSFGIRELKEEIERLDQRIDQVLKQNRGDINLLLEEQEKIKSRLKKLELKNSHG
jgi:uncharacterized protein YoxC